MGWGGASWRVHVTLDEHGGDKERQHAALWVEMQERLREVALDPRYAAMYPSPDDVQTD